MKVDNKRLEDRLEENSKGLIGNIKTNFNSIKAEVNSVKTDVDEGIETGTNSIIVN